MAPSGNGGYQRGLVDMSTGQVSREIFVNEDIYQQELERVFTRAWLFVGHASQIPKPGDYFVSSMGEESVLLCRDREEVIHVFLNSCRHRGMKVCRYDEGNTPVFTCPYHGWSYAADGKLVGVPYFKEPITASWTSRSGDWWRWPSCATTKAPSGPPGMHRRRHFWNTWGISSSTWTCRSTPGMDAKEVARCLGGIQKWLIPCNWKFPAENFSGDSYHNISHRSVDLVGIGPSGSGRRDMQERLQARRLQICFPERGHQTGVYLLPKDQPTPLAYQHSPVVSEYFRYCEEERRRRRGEWGRLTGSPGEIFPNTALHPRQPRTIAVWNPRGAHQTEVWRWYLVDQEAPPEVKDFLRQYYIRYSGPGGLTEQDDMENWNYAHAASRGTIARRYPYTYEQGMGFEVQNFAWDGLQLPGVVMDITEAKSSEHNLRNLYRRWAAFMEAESWDELATWRHSEPAQMDERPAPREAEAGKGGVP